MGRELRGVGAIEDGHGAVQRHGEREHGRVEFRPELGRRACHLIIDRHPGISDRPHEFLPRATGARGARPGSYQQ
jgi:hypothetical protein